MKQLTFKKIKQLLFRKIIFCIKTITYMIIIIIHIMVIIGLFDILIQVCTEGKFKLIVWILKLIF